MNIEVKNLLDSEVEIKVSVSWDEWKKHIDASVEELAKEVKIEGFRPGKAPRNILEQKVGANSILTLASEKAVNESYPKVLEEKKIEAIGQPKVEITKVAEGNDLEYKAVTAILPEVKLGEWRDDVKKINKEFKDKKVEVADKEVEEELEKLANHKAKLTKVDRKAKKGDTAIIDFDVLRDGVPIENGSSKDHPLVLGAGVFIPGFEDNILGAKAGDDKEFELAFPKEYHEKSLAGKKATFKVTVKEVQEKKMDEINDEFAKSVGDFKDLSALKKSMKEGMEKEKNHQQKHEQQAKIVEAITKKVAVELPEVLVAGEVARMISDFEGQIQQSGLTLDKYLQQMKKTREDIEKDMRPEAEKRVKNSLALEQVIKDQEIKVESKEVEEEMNKTLAMYKKVKDIEKQLDMKQLYEYARNIKLNEKLFDYLTSL